MHIPDGYLSLQTSIPGFGVMLPIWSVALQKLKKALNHRQLPLLSLCAAFSFIIMMFNIPLGASSVHAVGAVFIAILMGPWAACIAVSVALIIQAFVFGDGGILAIGVNCFNMAFVMPFAGYYVYRLIAGKSEITSRRSVIGIFAGSYIGINLAALFAAVEFGIQPLLFKTAGGLPQYGFFPLSVSVPAMMFEHLLVAGPVEGIITVCAVAYIKKFSPNLLDRQMVLNAGTEPEMPFFSRYKSLIIIMALLILATPLGLLASGTAWGEWDNEQVKAIAGFIPEGMEKLSGIWNALLPDYSIPGFGDGFMYSSAGYIISAIVGIMLIIAVMLATNLFIAKKGDGKG